MENEEFNAPNYHDFYAHNKWMENFDKSFKFQYFDYCKRKWLIDISFIGKDHLMEAFIPGVGNLSDD